MVVKKKFTNQEVNELLKNIAVALLLKGENRFRVSAYEEAAQSVLHLGTSLEDFWKRNELTKIPGVGSNIASHLNELFSQGKVSHFEQVFKGLPEALFELLKVQGIGPKNALKLCEKLKIIKKKNALIRLKKAALAGKIRRIEGFGEKSEQEILQGLNDFSVKSKRIPLFLADQICQDILEYLKLSPAVIRIDKLGSLRRRCASVGDIDISCSSKKSKEVIDWFCKYPKKNRVKEAGVSKASLQVSQIYQVDLRVELPWSYGSLLQHFTGSKLHNIHLREIALGKGLSLSEHGVKKLMTQNSKNKAVTRNTKLYKFRTEKEFYKFIGMQWVPPELREDQGEIELAQQNKLPDLVKLNDIKGDLHIHSNFKFKTSHDLGENSMESIAEKAKSLNYQYLAFSEHNPSVSWHKEKEFISIISKKKEIIDELNYSYNKNTQKKLFIFNSLEIDINRIGKRSVPDRAIDILDFAIISIHSSFKMGRKEMTDRILNAFDHPKLKILAHPTGRMIGKREGYELDWDRIFDFCKKNKKFLEVNAYPLRLDLPDFLVRQAIKNGVKIVINTDSHNLQQMDYMKYGVDNCQRGWAEKKDIINCLSYNNVKKLLVS